LIARRTQRNETENSVTIEVTVRRIRTSIKTATSKKIRMQTSGYNSCKDRGTKRFWIMRKERATVETEAKRDFIKESPNDFGEEEIMIALFKPIPYKNTEHKMKKRHSIIILSLLSQLCTSFKDSTIFSYEGKHCQQKTRQNQGSGNRSPKGKGAKI
jgi:hypothetical protein